ncbi:MAG: NACHT domain-containing protein, partial [Chloroflexota bacterium]
MSDQSHQQADQINNTNSFNTNKDGNQLVGNTVSGDINIGLSAEEVATTAIFVGKQLVKYAAQPLAHALLALKLGDEMDWSESLADLDDLADILERLTGDFENAQDGQDFFNKAGRITAKRIATAFEQLQDPLSEERLDLLTKQFSTLLKDTVLPTLLQTHFDRDTFIKKISNLPLDPAAYEAEEQPIIKRALGLTAELIFESADEIDNFTVATFGAFLKKTHLILEKVERVADQLASIHGSTYGEMQISAHEEFELSYRRLLSKKLDRLKLFGVPDFENHYLPLSPAYISLLARPLIEKDSGNHGENEPHFQKKQLSERFAELRQAEQVQPQNFEVFMAKHQRIFITGGAGAGKTTLLKKVAVYASNQQLPEELSEWRGKIPFFFRLRDITPDNPLPTTLDELPLKTQLTGLPSNPTRYVQQRFRSKQAILLIDGFDEVEEALQLETLEFVENVLEQHPDTICVLSGRPEVLQTEAIRQQLTQQTFMHIELQRMTAEQISQFIGLWFGALQKLVAENPSLLPEESASRLSVQQQQIQGQIRHSPQLRELATTPLLCALICALFQRNHQVNGKNVHELYQIGLRMLLKQRDGDRGIGLKRYGKLPEYADWKRPLAEIAYRSIEQNEPTIEADDLSHLLKIDGFETDVLIEYLTERASLLERLPNRRFEFLHRSFAEYLAALHIIDKRLVNVKWLHAARLDQAHWEGTIRQLVLNGVEADQTAILEALASGDEGDHSR